MDLKPHNVLIDVRSDGNFNCVICDFGSASVLGDAPKVQGFSAPEKLEFTVRYTPPEVFRRLMMKEGTRPSSDMDKSIDVYAFAITMFEVITREKVYKDLTMEQIIESVLAGYRPAWPQDITQDLGYLFLVDLVTSCWTESHTQRPKFHQINEVISRTMEHFTVQNDIRNVATSN
jgi:serine/threonine protein kinase